MQHLMSTWGPGGSTDTSVLEYSPAPVLAVHIGWHVVGQLGQLPAFTPIQGHLDVGDAAAASCNDKQFNPATYDATGLAAAANMWRMWRKGVDG